MVIQKPKDEGALFIPLTFASASDSNPNNQNFGTKFYTCCSFDHTIVGYQQKAVPNQMSDEETGLGFVHEMCPPTFCGSTNKNINFAAGGDLQYATTSFSFLLLLEPKTKKPKAYLFVNYWDYDTERMA